MSLERRTLSSFQCQVSGRKEYYVQLLLLRFDFVANAIDILDQRDLCFDKSKRPAWIQPLKLIEKRCRRSFGPTDEVDSRRIRGLRELD